MKHAARHSFLVRPGGRPRGELRVPGDKSISHRAAMLAAIADGETRVHGFLEGADCLATLRVFEAMGVTVTRQGGVLCIAGAGRDGLRPVAGALDLGNSGTSMRLLAGLLAGQAFDSVLTGDASLRKRPMGRVIEPLRQMGADIAGEAGDLAPLRIRGGRSLRGIRYRPPVASAQVKSCVLLAGLYADGDTAVVEPAVSRDHTERMLSAFGVELFRDGDAVGLRGGQRLTGGELRVPADLSSATFFMLAAAIVPGAEVRLTGVGVNPTRDGVIAILRAMGVGIALENERTEGGEPVADLRVTGGALRGIEIDPALVPLAIDEFPAVFVAAACAEGDTVLRGAAELRVKESDRIAVMADGLAALGVPVEVYPDGLRIRGGGADFAFDGGEIDSHGDHRIAMAFAMAGFRARDTIAIRDCANVATSFPGFVAMAREAGLSIEEANG
ncbi:3-phosphoshikimate 1-carboxyvinyltransferase [Salinisphaera sp. PC39]|uniref:3-phosphoshikimate 1-carboxyvinyltransferase n=1 Tax=Salinisphaera sp. PC39 TaxID=1304156 RepID=UPI0033415D2C